MWCFCLGVEVVGGVVVGGVEGVVGGGVVGVVELIFVNCIGM